MRELGKAQLPGSMLGLGIRSLEIRLIIMWRPWCLARLSSHARRDMESDYRMWAYNEFIMTLSRHATHHKYLTTLGASSWRTPWDPKDGAAWEQPQVISTMTYSVLVISYADLLWRQPYTLARLRAFLPEAASDLHTDFVPRLGVDYFPENYLKVHGTVAQYGEMHPSASVGYDPSEATCAVDTADPLRRAWTVLEPDEQRQAKADNAYLAAHS